MRRNHARPYSDSVDTTDEDDRFTLNTTPAMENSSATSEDSADATTIQTPSRRAEKLWQRKRRVGRMRSGSGFCHPSSYAQSARPAMPSIREEEEVVEGEPLGSNTHSLDVSPTSTEQRCTPADFDYYTESGTGRQAYGNRASSHHAPFSIHQKYRIRRGSSRAYPSMSARGVQKHSSELIDLRNRHDRLQAYMDNSKLDVEKRSARSKKEAEREEVEEAVERDLEVVREGMIGMALAEG